jgi:hypothetical protein
MFRTELTITPQERQLSRTARVLTVGSCFADSIGERLRLNKVQALVNPFGTVFQPLALAQLLRAATGEEQDWQQHLVEARGRWQSFDFHSTIGADSPVELLQLIQETVQRVGEFVRTAEAVVLTLGTAWAYRLRETGELVSNLHKLPAGLFEKELLTADEIVNGLAEVHSLLRRANPTIKIVLTVSPVRHIKDTLPLNAVSKSVLRVACHYLSELLPGVSYFPAYELLTDELRDYRFYAADMLHPSEVAEDYIWDRFARAYFDADFGRFRKEWAAVRQSLGHRPLHAGAPEHRTFLDQTRERLERLAGQGVEVRQELRDVQRQLAALPPPRPVKVPQVVPEDDEERIDIGGAENIDSTLPSSEQPVEQPTPSVERRHDNRRDRDGRRNGRNGQDRRNGRQAPAPEVVPEAQIPLEEVQISEVVEESITAAVEALLTQFDAELLIPEEGSDYPAKKKKRRSRGGAKRTARKNAARLASEQEPSQPASLAEEELVDELAHENAGVLAEDVVTELPVAAANTEAELNDAPESADTSEAIDDEVNTEILPTMEGPTPPRKRGTGPTPKKSKVITKSGLVKRGQRNGLYRSQAPEASEAATPIPEPAHGTAPIISPPIIPEILLERPAIDVAFTPRQLEESAPVPPVAEPTVLSSEAPEAPVVSPPVAKPASATKPRRGRPKAANNPSDEPQPPVVAETQPADQPAPTPTKKPSARAGKAAKPATAKKAPAKPAATKRGRPPGTKKTPPRADDPTT